MNYGEIKKTDIANGFGVRVSLFVSGCSHRCQDCFNSETWDFSYGQPFTAQTEEELLEAKICIFSELFVPGDDFSGLSRFLHIDEPLVGGTAEP